MCASSNIAVYAIEMTKLEVNGNLVTQQPGSSQLFDEKEDLIIKYEVDQSLINSPSAIVLHYYLRGDVDVGYYTRTNALFHAEIKTLQSCCIFFEDDLFQPVRVKGDESCLFWAVATHIISCCLHDVWTGRFPPGKKTGIKQATYEVVNELNQFISQKDITLVQIFLMYMPHKELMNSSKKL